MMLNLKKIRFVSIDRLCRKYERDRYYNILKQYQFDGRTYCVIKRKGIHKEEGLFASFLAVIKMMHIAIEENLIPVVDMQTEKNPYLSEFDVGKYNAWEYFFKQPFGEGIMDLGGCNMVYINEPPDNAFPSDSMDFLTNPEDVEWWRNFCRQYIHYSDRFLQYMERYSDVVSIVEKHRTLGVYLRGTDYMVLRPENHSVVPSAEESIRNAYKMMEQHKCDKIFLSSEDLEMFHLFEKEFGNDLLYIEQKRYGHNLDRTIMMTKEFVNSDVVHVGMNYLASVYLIAKCDALFAARCCGSIGALLLSDGYEETIFWNRGRYRMTHLNQKETSEMMFRK